MGYYTKYELSTDSSNNLEIIEYFRTECDSANYALNSDGEYQDECKWYEHEKDMRDISRKFPETVFTLKGEGEQSGDIWREYYKNGRMQRTEAKIIFESFNESKLD